MIFVSFVEIVIRKIGFRLLRTAPNVTVAIEIRVIGLVTDHGTPGVSDVDTENEIREWIDVIVHPVREERTKANVVEGTTKSHERECRVRTQCLKE